MEGTLWVFWVHRKHIWSQDFHWMTIEIMLMTNELPVTVFVWMQIVLSTGSWFVALCQILVLALPLLCRSTGTGALLVVLAPSKLPVLVFSLYANVNVSCRCIVAIASKMWNAIMWLDVLRGLSIDGCMNYDVLQHGYSLTVTVTVTVLLRKTRNLNLNGCLQ